MKKYFLSAIESICMALVFVFSFFLVYAGAFVLDDGLGGSPVPAICTIILGFVFFAIVITAIIEQTN